MSLLCFRSTYYGIGRSSPSHHYYNLGSPIWCVYINRLLTEPEGRTGEYWPEVVAVRTELSEVRTATTSGQYSPVRPSGSVSKRLLLYGTLFLIVKCTSSAINLFSFLSVGFLSF